MHGSSRPRSGTARSLHSIRAMLSICTGHQRRDMTTGSGSVTTEPSARAQARRRTGSSIQAIPTPPTTSQRCTSLLRAITRSTASTSTACDTPTCRSQLGRRTTRGATTRSPWIASRRRPVESIGRYPTTRSGRSGGGIRSRTSSARSTSSRTRSSPTCGSAPTPSRTVTVHRVTAATGRRRGRTARPCRIGEAGWRRESSTRTSP